MSLKFEIDVQNCCFAAKRTCSLEIDTRAPAFRDKIYANSGRQTFLERKTHEINLYPTKLGGAGRKNTLLNA